MNAVFKLSIFMNVVEISCMDLVLQALSNKSKSYSDTMPHLKGQMPLQRSSILG